ncbi:TNF receptor-associated factor 4-like [Dysidea avara]|uniref:TNF receptor-associated factor 4-like n=1 Tax=Dysidea avara TaxID=196820 RepID=UPI00332D7D5D
MAMSSDNSGCSGGYDYKFADDPPDRLVCNICHLPSRDPYLTTCCGHVFCKSCLDYVKKPIAVSNVCPVCREKEFLAYVNKQADREIRSLHVMCTNKERGCEWQGELNDINNHLGNSDGCQFEDVQCSNECGKVLQRQYLTSHVETECPCYKVDCRYCHITGGNQFIEGEHKKQCPKLPLPCPNSCTLSCPYSFRNCKGRARTHPYAKGVIRCISRKDMEEHKKECPLQEVKCSYKCGKMLQRQYLTIHIETECPCRKVDCWCCHITGEYQFIEGEHKKQCPKFPISCLNKCGVGSLPREDMETHRVECPLEMVQCEYHNVGCGERMMRKDLEFHKKEKMEKHLSLTSSQLTTVMMALHPIVTQAKHYCRDTHSASVILTAQWSLNLMAGKAVVKSDDQVCPVIVCIGDIHKERSILCSDSAFYSHDKGYKICLRVNPAGNGDGKGTHLSVFLYLMKGPHDDELSWPLRGKFEVKLLNQISDCKHHSGTMIYDDSTTDVHAGRVTNGNKGKGWGWSKFISIEDLHKVTPTRQYLKDDCIFFQVSKL